MRRSLFILILGLFWSCEWQPEAVQTDGLSVVEEHIITVGDTLSIALQFTGTNFTPIENPDTSIVEIIDHLESSLGSALFLVGRSEGEIELSFRYEYTGDDGVSRAAQYFIAVRVSESIPLQIHIGDPFELDYSTEMTTEQVIAFDSVSIIVGQNDPGGSFSVEPVPGNNSSIIITGESPGYASLIIQAYDTDAMLITSLFYEIDVSIRKVVMAELFTNTGCVNCPEANHYLDNLLANYSEDLSIVRYHVNWTDPFDPMNLYNAVEVETRRAFYNIFAAPGLVLDGSLVTTLDEDDWSTRIFNASQVGATLYITPVDLTESIDSLFLEFEVKTFGNVVNNVSIWSLVLEDSIDYLGSNGESLHMQVMRDMSSSSIGDLTAIQTFRHSLKKPDDFDLGVPLSILVFIQSEGDKAVLQSRKQTLN